MPKRTITSAQKKALDTGFLDLQGDDKSSFKPVKFTELVNSLEYVAALYTDKLTKKLAEKDATSSGDLADSIVAMDVQVMGSVYSVAISTKKYASFIDEGVDGWAKSRGSQYKFKQGTRAKGTPFTGKSLMVDSIKAWLIREGKIGRIKNRPISNRETKRAAITDTSTRAAITAAFMIKRQGIAPTHFWRDATNEMNTVIINEFSAALKIDMINNITNN